MTFKSVIVCRMIPGSDEKVAEVFDHYDRVTRPQDFGVIGRRLLSLHDLYIHVIERDADPEVSGHSRGLPAFQQVSEAISPYVKPYPSYWQNPSHSVAQAFYQWEPPVVPTSTSDNLLVIVQRIKPGAEPDVARIFAESDAGPLPVMTGVTGRWLHSMEDVFLHLMTRTDEAAAEPMGPNHHHTMFASVIDQLRPFVSPYSPNWQSHRDALANEFYSWRAEDVVASSAS